MVVQLYSFACGNPVLSAYTLHFWTFISSQSALLFSSCLLKSFKSVPLLLPIRYLLTTLTWSDFSPFNLSLHGYVPFLSAELEARNYVTLFVNYEVLTDQSLLMPTPNSMEGWKNNGFFTWSYNSDILNSLICDYVWDAEGNQRCCSYFMGIFCRSLGPCWQLC